MIGSVGSSGFPPPSVGGSSTQASLSLEQQQVIEDTLSNYDASNLSESDAQSIVSAFSEAGITPSKELAETMESLGFSAREVGDLAGVSGQQSAGGMPPPPPPPSQEEVDTVSSLIDTLFNSDDEDDAISFDDVMDYTSRILSLNDESKQEVMDLLEEYGSQSSELSTSDVSNVVSNTLSQILGDSNNYKRTSFYA